jgi:hypothetical protein
MKTNNHLWYLAEFFLELEIIVQNLYRNCCKKFVQKLLYEICTEIMVWNLYTNFCTKFVHKVFCEICTEIIVRNFYRNYFTKFVQKLLYEICTEIILRNLYRKSKDSFYIQWLFFKTRVIFRIIWENILQAVMPLMII